MSIENLAGVTKQIMLKSNGDTDYAAFAHLILGAVCREDLQQFSEQERLALAREAAAALLEYKVNKPVLHFAKNNITRNGKPVVLINVVNENKPFLLDSVLNTINEAKVGLYMVAHPIIDIEPRETGILVSTAQFCEQKQHRLSLMQFVIENMEGAEQEQLRNKLQEALNSVSCAVTAWPSMVAKVKTLADNYKALAVSNDDAEMGAVAEFLSWLIDNNFTFLGVGEYQLNGEKLAAISDSFLGIDLPRELNWPREAKLLTITKADKRSKVHKFAWLEDIYVQILPSKGDKLALLRIVGLFTTSAYTNSVFSIPYLRDKAHIIVDRLGYNVKDHSGKALLHILEHYPRDEMFRTDVDQLAENVGLILELVERPRLRVLSHQLNATFFVTTLIYLPKTQYNISNCEKIGQYLLAAYGGDFYEYNSFFMNSAITRVQYIIHRKEAGVAPQISREALEQAVASITRSWNESLDLEAASRQVASAALKLAAKFPPIYRDSFDANSALEDAEHILALSAEKSLFVHFYRSPTQAAHQVSLKLYHRQTALMLSERVPLLENMGFKVINEQTFELLDQNDQTLYMHFMQLEHAAQAEVDLAKLAPLLNVTFEQAWAEEIDDDAYNKLCQSAGLAPREVLILRVYGRYLQQTGIAYSQEHLANALHAYSDIARDLYHMFYQKFAPNLDAEESKIALEQARSRIEKALQAVPNLDDDLILRRYVNLIEASQRTNAFACQENGELRAIIAIKFDSRLIEGLPQPKPYREIFVYGMLVEGVHLRFGPVARGGIRWSDRPLDYRTEVLGLVKAQQVKNVVIVPVGSKGGFYPHQLPQNADRAQLSEAARQAYIGYIDAMLSITDNLRDGKIVAPKDVQRLDGDDPYFVVAADKGTASFSDTANAISQKHEFWLDDAFASGGSAGYDHKKMGITAKGGWEAVKRHFRELLNRDIQNEPFTVIGVGDMSGDVFGNGMLLSQQIKLIAAFDHRDIFIDPNPDIAVSYAERQRLFNMERSSWQDYDISKISAGGGVFSRSQKEIKLTPEAAAAIGMKNQAGTPFEIINAILKAEVDLLWFGGIGTYVRASSEPDAAVGDRANDNVRITGNQLRAKIIGEGANLGLTQRGRIEYSMAGGRCDTDAIDNSAGVNCSDVEVNIKIALADAMRSGKLTREQRNELLKNMTDDVAKLVLANNYRQSLLLSLAQTRAVQDLPQQMRFMASLERQGRLDRNVEILPSDSELKERLLHGQALTRPELSVLMAYAKLTLQDELTKNSFLDDEYFKARLFAYFPALMQEKFATEIERHQLRRPIIATLLANSMVNSTGPSFAFRLADKAGADIIEVAKAYIAIHDGFAFDSIIQAIDALDNVIPGQAQNELYKDVMVNLAQTIELFLSMRKTYPRLNKDYSLGEIVEKMTHAYNYLYDNAQSILPEELYERLEHKREKYVALGLSETFARKVSFLQIAIRVPDIVLMSVQEDIALEILSRSYFKISTIFRIDQIEEASNAIAVIDYYDDMALARAKDNIGRILCQITVNIVKNYTHTETPVAAWLTQKYSEIEPITARMNALIEADLNISRFVVAASMMGDLLELSH